MKASSKVKNPECNVSALGKGPRCERHTQPICSRSPSQGPLSMCSLFIYPCVRSANISARKLSDVHAHAMLRDVTWWHAGLGKTTLAHVVARHCGYRPLEINASDDRTATTLVSRINDAVQMQAVIGAARPNCVIIDEIDGAAGARFADTAVGLLPPAGVKT